MNTSPWLCSVLAAFVLVAGCATCPKDLALSDYRRSVLNGEQLVCVASCKQSSEVGILISKTLQRRGIHSVGLSSGGMYTDIFVFEGRAKEAREILLELGLADTIVLFGHQPNLQSEQTVDENLLEKSDAYYWYYRNVWLPDYLTKHNVQCAGRYITAGSSQPTNR